MVCLYCGKPTRVANSRIQKRRNSVWRRRVCNTCNNVFTTRELPVLSQSVLFRRADNKRPQPFFRDQLFLSIAEVCKHRPRGTIESAALTETIMALALKQLHDGVIERNVLVGIAQTVLERFDTITARLYAAYHPL